MLTDGGVPRALSILCDIDELYSGPIRDGNQTARSSAFREQQRPSSMRPAACGERRGMGPGVQTERRRGHETSASRDRAVKRILLAKDPKERSLSGGGLGMKVVGGKLLSGTSGELAAYVAAVYKGGMVETLGEVQEGDRILEWNGIKLTGKTYEEVQRIVNDSSGEIELVIKSGAKLNEVYEMVQSASTDKGYESAPDTAAGHAECTETPPPVPAHRPVRPADGAASPAFSLTPRAASPLYAAPARAQDESAQLLIACGCLRTSVNYDPATTTLFVTVISGRELPLRRSGAYPNPFVKIYLLPGRRVENKRRTKYIAKTDAPDWNQTVVYKDLSMVDVSQAFVELTVWDYDKLQDNTFLGQVVVAVSAVVDGFPRWFTLDRQQSAFDHGHLMPVLGNGRPFNEPLIRF